MVVTGTSTAPPGSTRTMRPATENTASTFAPVALVRWAVRVPSQALVKVAAGRGAQVVVPPLCQARTPAERLPGAAVSPTLVAP
ncbi:hypothetical protein [Dactylosporangium cerinum]